MMGQMLFLPPLCSTLALPHPQAFLQVAAQVSSMVVYTNCRDTVQA